MTFSQLKIGDTFRFEYDADNKTLRKVDARHYVVTDGSWGNHKFEYGPQDGGVVRSGSCPIPPTLSKGVFGWDAVRLHEAYSAKELADAILEIHYNPINANPAHAKGTSVYLHTKAARTRMEALARAVSYHTA